MQKAQPLISILTTAYNAEATLAESIDSVIAQDWPHKEYIIVNDGSTDRSSELAHSYAERHAWIRVIDSPNQGVAKARNLAWKASAGEMIAVLDADDIYLPRALENLHMRLSLARQQLPTVGLAYGNFIRFFDNGEAERMEQAPDAAGRGGPLLRQLFCKNCVLPSASLLHRETLRKLGGWRNLKDGQDFDLMLRAAREHDFAKVGALIVRYRRHRGQRTVSCRPQIREGYELVLADFLLQHGPAVLFPEARTPQVMASQMETLVDRMMRQSRYTPYDVLLYMLCLAQGLAPHPRRKAKMHWLAQNIPSLLEQQYGHSQRHYVQGDPFAQADQVRQCLKELERA